MQTAQAAETPPRKEQEVGHAWRFGYELTRMLFRLVRPLIARLRTEGIENIPAEGPVILALNHIAWIDIPLASVRVPRVTHYMAKVELFKIPILGAFMRMVGSFPVRRGEGDRESLRTAERLLAEGHILVIFPEGHRSGGHLLPGRSGTALIALRSNAPVIPVAIAGTEKVFKGLRYGPFAPRVTIRYGKPLQFGTNGRRTRENLERATDQIMRAIAAMLPPSYRGAYADDTADDAAPPAPPTEQ